MIQTKRPFEALGARARSLMESGPTTAAVASSPPRGGAPLGPPPSRLGRRRARASDRAGRRQGEDDGKRGEAPLRRSKGDFRFAWGEASAEVERRESTFFCIGRTFCVTPFSHLSFVSLCVSTYAR